MAMKIPSGGAARAGISTAAQRTNASAGAAQKPEAREQAREDKLELSEEALAILQGKEPPKAEEAPDDAALTEPRELSPAEQKMQDKLSAMKSMKQMLDSLKQQNAQIAEQSEKQADAMKESLEKMKRCSKIAKNIQKGHKVPPKDEKYLLENDPKLYMMAMALRMLEDPDNKKVKSELKDEEEQQQEEAASGVEGTSSEASADIAAIEMGTDVSVE